MNGVSVLTLARNRTPHLLELVEGLRRSTVTPAELVIVDMNDAPLEAPETPFPTRMIRLEGGALPLAAARNCAAREGLGDILMFLDADCIPSAGLLENVARIVVETDGIVCPEALYLGPDDAREGWTEAGLLAAGRPHPVRPFPETGWRTELNYGLFWSLAFAMRRSRFESLGGFDEAFVGYGGEDTDFGFRARDAGVPLVFVSGSPAFHQHHEVSDPPVEHLADIVRNAQVFRRKWGIWPMEGWLAAFEASGAVVREGDAIRRLYCPRNVCLPSSSNTAARRSSSLAL